LIKGALCFTMPTVAPHVRSGLTACGDCVDICPQDALSIPDGGICIDHSTCDGCGACAFVCPTGAIRGLRTSTQDLLVAVQGRIADARLANPSTAPTVIFIQLAPDEIGVDAIQGGVGKPSLSIAVAKIGCVGPEVWLGALAYGAAAVVLQTPEDHPRQLQAVLVEQHAWATTILAGVGLSPRRIQLRAAGFSEEAPVDSADVPGRPADFSPFQSNAC
jgi:NAD-dependent dihydropyrimidine dehydrogenase PreA subunit